MVGLLPAVRQDLKRASQPRKRPPLLVCEHPQEVGPEESAVVNDLRAVLLEIASAPPRLKQDHSLFQKEFERFLALLESLPAWWQEALKWSNEGRLFQALSWARSLKLVANVSEDKQNWLQLTSQGHRWLASGVDEQYAALYKVVRVIPTRQDPSLPHHGVVFIGSGGFGGYGYDDSHFLGEVVKVQKLENSQFSPYYWDYKPEDHQELRTHLDRALAVLKPGVFYRLDSVAAHLAFGEHNPLNVGLAPEKVAVFWGSRPVPSLDEEREESGRLLIDGFVRKRLIPLGCVQAARDEQGRLCIARLPRYDALFGREVARSKTAPAATVGARVVVQPDFSVIVIGPNPTPAAELAPFCERTARGGGQGAILFKITRDSVVKAVSLGLKPEEILARLQRHSSHEVPANVIREVQDWSHWVRRVVPSTVTVLRCPDRDTADRVLGVLKRQAERVNDTWVAIDQKRLSAADRNKLRSQGILVVSDDPGVPVVSTKVRKKR
jgi:hypothetical protein